MYCIIIQFIYKLITIITFDDIYRYQLKQQKKIICNDKIYCHITNREHTQINT